MKTVIFSDAELAAIHEALAQYVDNSAEPAGELDEGGATDRAMLAQLLKHVPAARSALETLDARMAALAELA